jgi:N12 class adenine-specific DNA methylase
LESFMTAMISGISLPKGSGAQRRAFPAILSPKHLAAAARLAAEIKSHHMPELASWTVKRASSAGRRRARRIGARTAGMLANSSLMR